MTVDVRSDPRYLEVVARQRAMLEPGFGSPINIESAELSPDGSLVAVVARIGQPEGHGRTELRVIGSDGARSRTLAGEGGDASAPRWSGDGRLAFLADHGHRHRPTPWLAERVDDGIWQVRELGCPPGIPEHLRWSPDGTHLLLTVAGLGAEQADGLGSGTLGQELEADVPSWWPEVESTDGGDEWRSAWSLRIADSETRRLSPLDLNVWEADWLGDTDVVAVVSGQPAEDAWYHARLVRLGPAPGDVVDLYAPEWQIQFAAGSPDGTRAVIIEGVASDRYFTNGDLVLAAADGSGARPLGHLGADIGAVRWTGTDTLVAMGMDGLEWVVLRVDLDADAGGDAATGPAAEPPVPAEAPVPAATVTELFRTSADLGGRWLEVSAAADRVALVLHGPDEPPRAVVIEDGRATTILGTEHAGRDLVRATLTERRAIAWTAPDDTRVEGILALPQGTPPFATILWVHGGPVSAVGFSFPSTMAASLLEAGYALVYPNPRGSIGRGRDFAAAVVGDMGGPADTGDLLAAMDQLVAEGIADPSRLVVAGVSYGGYMAALLPAIDDRFAAAIVGSPLTDLVSAYYGSSLSVFVDEYVGGRPDERIERYLDRSSVFAGKRLRTPSLISVGLRDRATPPGQAIEHFRALREQGVPAQLLLYPEEGHGIRAIEAATDWTARVILWLERFVPART